MEKIEELEEIQEARKELERITADPIIMEKYESREKYLREEEAFMSAALEDAKEKGWNTGIKEGMSIAQKEMIINLIEREFTIKEISEIVNLNEGEVKRIIESND